MTTNNVHVLAGGPPAAQLVLAERSQADSAIAIRAIRRLFPDLKVRLVTDLAEAERVVTRRPPVTVLVASGLDGKTHLETIRWFAVRTHGILIALLEDCDHRQGRQAREAGASYVCSKPELVVTQLRYELAARLARAVAERPTAGLMLDS